MLFTNNGLAGLVECVEECGNMTHPSIPVCGRCVENNVVVFNRENKSFLSARRSFIAGF